MVVNIKYSFMNKLEQKKVVISKIRTWAGSDEEARRWFDEEFISAIGSTPSAAIDEGKFNALIDHIESISLGGHA